MTDQIDTNNSYPLYSEDHPKYGSTKNVVPTIRVPEEAHTNAAPQGLGLDNFASDIAAKYHAQRTVRKHSRVGPDFREFLQKRNQRQDSQATLVDFARRPSRTNEGKFRLQVVPSDPQSTAPERPGSSRRGSANSRPGSSNGPTDLRPTTPLKASPGLHGGEWGAFSWRPDINPIQPTHAKLQRLESDATLVDTGSWRRGSRQSSRSGSRSGSFTEDPFRKKSDLTTLDALPHTRLRQPSFFQPVLEIDPVVEKDRGLLIGGVKPLDPDLDQEKENKTTEPELAVAEPQTVTEEPKSTHQEHVIPTTQETFVTTTYPEIADPVDPCRNLTRMDLMKQRVVFSSNVFAINVAMLVFALFAPKNISGRWVLSFIVFIKSKDCISSLIGLAYLIYKAIKEYFVPPQPVESKWILSLIPAFSESEEMIRNCVFSLRDNDAQPHKQVMCIILDGKPRDVKQYMRITTTFKRQYVTSRFKRNEVVITAGFMEDVPVIVFEKVKNAGKKDSLILCHDLFNVMREDAPLYTKLLRKEIERNVLPSLVGEDFPGFDMVFCTDADSIIHKGAIAGLANALVRDPKAIASCGLVLVELEAGAEWSYWNLYQQFQYNFGQFVRRQAESVWGKVTCLPGCITMVAVRPEMAGAMTRYAAPITAYPVLLHQVQYLGTDRRLTYSMLSQSKDLHTLFVPDAVSETVAPQSLKHYLSQRRRWGSNAYFNNYFYFAGENMIWITRLWACIEVTRLSLVYYRVANTILFIYGLVSSFNVMSIIPLLIVSQLPTLWFLINTATNKQLRQRAHKILLGLAINKFMAPIMSVCVFTIVVKNLGSQAWGLTHGATSAAPAAAATTAAAEVAEKEKAQTQQGLLESLEPRNGSIMSIITEESSIGTNSPRPNSIASRDREGESEVNEIDEEDPREKIVGLLAAGL
ncbi:glycosyltransferase family 2 protein, partial [Aureobasidium melanogenum]